MKWGITSLVVKETQFDGIFAKIIGKGIYGEIYTLM